MFSIFCKKRKNNEKKSLQNQIVLERAKQAKNEDVARAIILRIRDYKRELH